MTRRHGLYLASAIAVGGLLYELGWFLEDRLRLHLVDNGIRLTDWIRGRGRV